ncbi:MAG TPA: hypothetical protein VL069_15490 [Opitutus sp.]|nr:hypothetical protein [Opitutus sp.]
MLAIAVDAGAAMMTVGVIRNGGTYLSHAFAKMMIGGYSTSSVSQVVEWVTGRLSWPVQLTGSIASPRRVRGNQDSGHPSRLCDSIHLVMASSAPSDSFYTHEPKIISVKPFSRERKVSQE